MAVTLESRLLNYKKGNVLTPFLDRYFRDPPPNHSERTMEVIKGLATQRPRDRTRAFSASSLGSCMRAQSFRYLDYPGVQVPDPRLQGIFLNGKWIHLKWQAVLLEIGIVDEDHLEVPVYLDDTVKGTIDAICEIDKLKWIVDFKGVNPQSFAKYRAGEKNLMYSMQLQAYMKATGIPRALLLYENKATGEYYEQQTFADSDESFRMQARVMALRHYMDVHLLPPPLHEAPANPECRGCPFQLDCVDAEWTDKYLEEDEIPL